MANRRYKEGESREQAMLLPPSVEDYVGEDNPVRAIDAYVESLDLGQLGFQHAEGGLTVGQPAYAPAALLKLYLYGYLMGVRSSRRLERETRRNLEVIWLLAGLRPSYKTIADFRKANAEALKAANRDFVLLCRQLDLYGGELVAIDGSFFRGNVAKARIFTRRRLSALLARIEQDIEAYHRALDEAEREEERTDSGTSEGRLGEKLEALRARQARYQGRLAELERSGESQHAEVDADARLLRKRGQTVAGYNVQTAVDAKHKLLVAAEASGEGNDTRQLAPMAKRAQQRLEVEAIIALADSGYFSHAQIQACVEANITPYVPEKAARASKNAKAFDRQAFVFEPEAGRYRCPQGRYLRALRSVEQAGRTMNHYASRASDCAACPMRAHCLPPNTPVRSLYRWEHEELAEAHRQRMAESGPAYLRRRAGLAEHPFGTLKLSCGWLHFLVRGKLKVNGELSLMMLCYNLRRVLNLLGPEGLRAALRERHALA